MYNTFLGPCFGFSYHELSPKFTHCHIYQERIYLKGRVNLDCKNRPPYFGVSRPAVREPAQNREPARKVWIGASVWGRGEDIARFRRFARCKARCNLIQHSLANFHLTPIKRIIKLIACALIVTAIAYFFITCNPASDILKLTTFFLPIWFPLNVVFRWKPNLTEPALVFLLRLVVRGNTIVRH